MSFEIKNSNPGLSPSAPPYDNVANNDPTTKIITEVNNTEYGNYNLSSKWGNAMIVFFVVMLVYFVLLVTFNPKFVRSNYIVNDGAGSSKNLPDPARCFVGSILAALLTLVIVWLFCSSRY